MAEIYALLRPDSSLLYAQRKGDGWAIVSKKPDAGPQGRRACVFVIGQDVLGLEAAIPARSENESRRAAPFAVEDELAVPVDTVHVALSARSADAAAARKVHVVSRELMEAWIGALKANGLGDASLVAAHSVLPEGDVLLEAGEYVLGRIDTRSFAIDRSLGPDVLAGMLNGHEAVELFGAGLANDIRRPATGEAVQSDADLLTRLAGWAENETLVNLRQASYAARGKVELGSFAQWRASALLAGAAALLGFGFIFAETAAMTKRTESLDARTRDYVRSGWPEANGDIRQALQASRAASGAGTEAPSVLTLTAVLYEALASVPGSELRSLQYDRSRNLFRVSIAFDGYGEVDQLARLIEEKGLTVQRGDARQSGGKVVGDLMVRAGG